MPVSRPVLTGMSSGDLRALVAEWGEPAYRAEQVFRAVWRDGATDPDAMTTLAKALRARLREAVAPEATTVVEVEESTDGTTKWLLGLADGARVETVLIPEGE